MKSKSTSVAGKPAKKAASSKPAATKEKRSKPESSAVPESDLEKHPQARGSRTSASREEIRVISHRVMGSRQSQRPVERHDQPRKKR